MNGFSTDWTVIEVTVFKKPSRDGYYLNFSISESMSFYSDNRVYKSNFKAV